MIRWYLYYRTEVTENSCTTCASCKYTAVGRPFFKGKKSEVDSANASGTQALTLRGLSNPGVLRLGVVYREAVGRYTVITPP